MSETNLEITADDDSRSLSTKLQMKKIQNLEKEVSQLRSELDAANGNSINRECLTEFVRAYESLKSGTDCAITDSDVSNAFARAVEAVNSELRRTE